MEKTKCLSKGQLLQREYSRENAKRWRANNPERHKASLRNCVRRRVCRELLEKNLLVENFDIALILE